MAFENDLNHTLSASTARARTRIENARKNGDPLEMAQAEIKLLRLQVDTLARLVVELATIEVDGGGTSTQIGKRLLKLAGPLVHLDATDDEPDAEVAQTAYRGAVPGTGAKLCARCGTMLDDDEPEMTQSMGRVCTSCFARGE